MKRVKSDGFVVLGVGALVVCVGVLTSNVKLNNTSLVETNAYQNVEQNNKHTAIKNELPEVEEIKENKKENVTVQNVQHKDIWVYPCDSEKIKNEIPFESAKEGTERSYLEALTYSNKVEKEKYALKLELQQDASVYSVSQGTVKNITQNNNIKEGYDVEISYANGVDVVYSNLKQTTVTIGQKVGKNQKIGQVGELENKIASDNKLLLYVIEGEKVVNPNKFLKK